MNSKAYEAEREKTCQIISLEKSVIKQFIETLNSKEIATESLENLQKKLEKYYYILCIKGNEYSFHAKKESLIRITRFLLCYPVKFHIDIATTEYVYEKMWLIDMATFCLYQLCESEIKTTVVDHFLRYTKDSAIGKICVIYAYRIAPKFIRDKYNNLMVEDLNEKELYYGITTGYFQYGRGNNPAICQLKNMSATETLNKLANDGFIIL